MLHTDIPTHDDIRDLLTARVPASVSIYVETSPIPAQVDAVRLAFKDMASTAVGQLRAGEIDREQRLAAEAVEEHLDDLQSDSAFWQHLSHSLAVFVTPDSIRTFRLPNQLGALVEVADRFYVKPLLRALTFPQTAFVLALSQNDVRLVEVTADSPAFTVDVSDLPADAVDAVGVDSISGRSPQGRAQGSEGLKMRLRQYAREVDRALRPVLAGSHTPLVLAAAEPLESIYRSVNTYSYLLAPVLSGNPDQTPDHELAERVRPVLDEYYQQSLANLRGRFDELVPAGRAISDLSDVSRAATQGAVDSLLVDIDRKVSGTVDEETGAIEVADSDDASNYGVVDEVVRRVLLSGGNVFALRTEDLPNPNSQVAAILRFAPVT